MTARTGLFVAPDGSGNGTTPLGGRLALATLLARPGASPLAVREGVLYDGGGVVVAGNTDTSPMSYSVRAAGFVQCTTAANGATVSANDGTVKVATTAAPATDKRIDVVWFRQHHIAGDGGTDAAPVLEFGVTQGATAANPNAPAIPTDATELARATVTAGTTSTSTLTISQTHAWTALHGTPIPVRNQAERDALGGYEGLRALRLDTGRIDVYTGGMWRAADLVTGASLIMSGADISGAGSPAVIPWTTAGGAGTYLQDVSVANNTAGTASTRVVIPADGMYRYESAVRVIPNGGSGAMYVRAGANGNPNGGGLQVIAYHPIPAAGTGNFTYRVGREQRLSAGDYLEVFIELATGMTLKSGVASTFNISRVGS